LRAVTEPAALPLDVRKSSAFPARLSYMFAAMPPFQILLASVNSGAAARNNFWRLPKSGAFPHIDGQSPKQALNMSSVTRACSTQCVSQG
jgi:hypothetical protein